MEYRDDGSLHLFVALCCWTVSLFSMLAIALWSWSFKDGLGPESYGWLASWRFFATGVGLLSFQALDSSWVSRSFGAITHRAASPSR